jgi:hypothetical protein
MDCSGDRMISAGIGASRFCRDIPFSPAWRELTGKKRTSEIHS